MASNFISISFEETVTLMSNIADSYAAAGDPSIDCVTLLKSGDNEHPYAKHYVSADRSVVFSVDWDGYIYAVLANKYASPRTSGRAALAEAVRLGGRYLDSYSRNEAFYTQFGFVCVARDVTNPEYADPELVGKEYLYFVLPEFKDKFISLQSEGDAQPAEERYEFFTGALSSFFTEATNFFISHVEGVPTGMPSVEGVRCWTVPADEFIRYACANGGAVQSQALTHWYNGETFIILPSGTRVHPAVYMHEAAHAVERITKATTWPNPSNEVVADLIGLMSYGGWKPDMEQHLLVFLSRVSVDTMDSIVKRTLAISNRLRLGFSLKQVKMKFKPFKEERLAAEMFAEEE